MLGLAKSGQNHRRIIDIAAAAARMKNVHTTLEDSVYYPHLSDLNKTRVVHCQVPIDDACMLGARRGADKRMGRVLADGAAYRGGGSSTHFHMSFLSLLFECVFYVELCTTYTVVRTVQTVTFKIGLDS